MLVEFATGSVFFEVELMLSSDSGRPKHIDPVEQGGWLVLPFEQALTSTPLEGVAFGRVRYWGDQCQPQGEPLIDHDIGGYRQTVEAADAQRRLRLVLELGRALAGGEGSEVAREVAEWSVGARDVRDITDENARATLWDVLLDEDGNPV